MRRALTLTVLALATPAGAQSLLPGPAEAGRYQMQPVPGGVARLDTMTGEMSLCRISGGTLRCRPGQEDTAAAPPAEAQGGQPPVTATPPQAEEDAEVDRAIGTMKRFFRAFRDVQREFEDEPARSPEAAPDRT